MAIRLALILVSVDEGEANKRLMAPEHVQPRLLQSLWELREIRFPSAGWIVSGLGRMVLVSNEESRRSGSLSVQSHGSLPWAPYCSPAAALEEGLFPHPTRPKHSFSMQDRGLKGQLATAAMVHPGSPGPLARTGRLIYQDPVQGILDRSD